MNKIFPSAGTVDTSPVLVKYVRDKHRNPRGVIVAVGNGMVGFSLANRKDKFDKELGKSIALNRAFQGFNVDIPRSIFEEFHHMMDRSERYFK